MSVKKIILYVVVVSLLVFGIWGYKLIWGKPFNFDHFVERYLIETALSEPEVLTMIGIVDNTKLDFHSHKLTDASPAHTYSVQDRHERYLNTLNRYDRDRLTDTQAISFDMMSWLLGMNVESTEWMFHDYPVNQMSGVQKMLPLFITKDHLILNEKSAQNYISRLRAIETKFEQVRESVLYRADRGVIPPRLVIDHVLAEMTEFISGPAVENPLYDNFENVISELENISPEKKDELHAEALLAVQNEVTRGYNTLIATFEEIYDLSGDDIGAWALPDGDRYYQYLARFHTSLPLTPDEIHDIGLQEVDRIQTEMFGLFDEVGISGESVAARFAILDEDERMFYPDTANVRDQIVADYKDMIAFLTTEMAPFFNRTPSAPVDVRRVPEYAEATAPFAFYNIPAMDGSRPGVFFINLRAVEEIPKYGMMTLTAHEAIPGHHFQLALAQEVENLPTIRKVYPITVSAEGWALYTEALVAEAGLYDDDPYGDLGRLQAEIFRAARLVVDTGIHHKRWTRDEAIEYMHQNTGLPMGDIISEIERYIVMPGQALAYKPGMMHIQNLRKHAESELGDSFDIREFHDVILQSGLLPMQVLTTVVEQYIERNSH